MRFNEAYIYQIPKPKLAKDLALEVKADCPRPDWQCPDLDLVGLEIEIEGVGNIPHPDSNWWKTVHDGSLRGGWEYKTYAISPRWVPLALKHLFDHLKNEGAKPKFSERTGIHVHVDFHNKTAEDFIKFLLVYLAFERYLYLFAGPDRMKNNFCVPLGDCNLVDLQEIVSQHEQGNMHIHQLENLITNLIPQKYAAFNCIPLFSRGQNRDDGVHNAAGTIEFRHMDSTNDMDKILAWVGMLMYMKAYVLATPYNKIKQEILALNTSSAYYQFASDVFGPYSQILVPMSLNWKLLADSLTLTKQALATRLVVAGKDFLRSGLAARIMNNMEEKRKYKNKEPVINWGDHGAAFDHAREAFARDILNRPARAPVRGR